MHPSPKSPLEAAELHSLGCFLNSLLREWDKPTMDMRSNPHLRIPLSAEKTALIPIRKVSALGRHQYAHPFVIDGGERTKPIPFSELIQAIVHALTREFDTTELARDRFLERVANSHDTILAALLSRRTELEKLYSLEFDFLAAEQGLIVGHNFHPTPKSRDEFTAEDLAIYSPEFGGAFPLGWWWIHPDFISHSMAEEFADREWLVRVARQDLEVDAEFEQRLGEGFTPYPLHPWQLKVIETLPEIIQGFRDGWIRPIGHGKKEWSATSSVRSLYQEDSPIMLKFSMSVRLTNSVRHLLEHEVARGLQLSDVLATPLGQEYLARHPNFRILREPATLAIKNGRGGLFAETIVVARENPYFGSLASPSRSEHAVLATLTQDSPYFSGDTLVAGLVRQFAQQNDLPLVSATKQWLAAYLGTVVAPLLDAQANYGIVLGAHQQNLILGFEQGLPVSAAFRDCQGTGYSELGFKNFAAEVASLDRANGNIVSEKMGNALFLYYLFINSTFNVIAALAEVEGVEEAPLLAQVREFLIGVRLAGVKDSSALDALLENSHLYHKGNFLCAFRGMNENTTADPLAIYIPIANPLAPLAPMARERV